MGDTPGRRWRDRLGGTDGNELLTHATAAVLTLLLVAEGVTVIHMEGLVGAHMFIGLVLIPPVLLKLSSTGYRAVRYYAGPGAYRDKGPPSLPLRLLAPPLVVATVTVFTTGAILLADGHKSGLILELHKVSFIVWVALFGIHFLAYAPRVVRSLRGAWHDTRRFSGGGWRASLVTASIGGGLALALTLAPAISSWRP
jgi:hypothetical protein